ncbi:unnamed protein product [Blepharisma stoltei]|uniref:Uncharacterized protein n=1 Tax=Blepharisma stoltei TaxID=1481888 RepID=A0AAU9IMV4_9CILI|nr:unnamed protein product [Blepharisma stoltei]
MERTASKFLARRQKLKQPQQNRMVQPPPLQDFQVDEDDLDKWRVINMQYRALFKKKHDTSQDNRPISPISSDSSPEKDRKITQRKLPKLPNENAIGNKLDQQYLTKKLKEIENTQTAVVTKPSLHEKSVQDLLNLLPKGGTLLEEAEILISTNNEVIEQGTEQYENLLRNVVEELHLKEIEENQQVWSQKINSIYDEIEKITAKNNELQALLRKHSIQTQSESEEKHEIMTISNDVKDMEMKCRLSNEENQLLEETINMLKNDIAELSIKFQEKEAQLMEELNVLHHRLTSTENEQVEELANECKNIEEANEKLEKEIKEVEKMWKGEHENLKEIIEAAEDGHSLLKQELGNIKESKNKLEKERQALQAKKAKLQKRKNEFYNKSKDENKGNSFVEAKNKQALVLHIDGLLTEASRKIMDTFYGRDTKIEPENLLKKSMKNLFLKPKNLDSISPELKSIRDTLGYLKDQHNKSLENVQEANTKNIDNITSRIEDLKKASHSLSKSIGSFSNLSPIRMVSPFRESSLLSISKLKEITGKIDSKANSVRLERSPSNISQVSRSSSAVRSEDPEIEKRRMEHKLFLDRSRLGF